MTADTEASGALAALPAPLRESPGDAAAAAPQQPLDLQTLSLVLLAVVAVVAALWAAKNIVAPILLGVMASYALMPVVQLLQRWRVPQAVGSGLVLAVIAGLLAWGAWSLSDQAEALVETLPQVTQKIRRLAQADRGQVSPIEKVQQAAADLQAAAYGAPADGAAARPQSRAQRLYTAATSGQDINIRDYLLSGTLGAMALLAQVAVVFGVALFMMASGNSLRRKLVRLAGPRLSQKKVTLQTLDEITAQIQRYLLVQVGTSAIVGVGTWLAFYALGVQQSAVWGVVAGVTNLVPYFGATLVGIAAAAVALLQFGTLQMVVAVSGASFVVHALVANLLAPWWMGRASGMSPLVVFVVVLLFGWLWGVWGLLLGVPILMAVKAVCDRIDGLKGLGEFLGA